MVYAHPAPFDAKRDFATLTFFRANGIAFERGVPFSKDAVDGRTLKLLYDNRKIGYADPSDEEAAGVFAPATVKAVGGGWYEVAVPWIDDPEKVQGQDRANFRATQLRDAGEPTDHHGVAIVDAGEGTWRVNAEWLKEPESFTSLDQAYARASELRKAGAPQAGTEGAPGADDKPARVKALVDGNSLEDLQKKAEGLEGTAAAKTKADFATLIVAADRDKPEGASGGAA